MRLAIVIAVVSGSLAPPARARTLEVGPGDRAVELDPWVEVLVDPTRELGFDDVRREPVASRFIPAGSTDLAFGLTRAAVWARIAVRPVQGAHADWVLLYEIPPTAEVDVFHERSDGQVEHQRGGTTVPVAARPLPGRAHAFPVRLAIGEREVLYVRLVTDAAMLVDLSLLTPAAYEHRERREESGLFLLCGLYLALALHQLLAFAASRRRTHLELGLLTVTFGLFLGVNFGLVALVPWPGGAFWARAASPAFAAISLLIGTLFARDFVESVRRRPRLDRLFLVLAVVEAATAVLALAAPFAANVAVTAVSVAFFVPAMIACRETVAEGGRSARLFLMAMTVALVGGVLFLLMVVGVLGFGFWTAGLGPVAFVTAGTLLSMAVGERVADLERVCGRLGSIGDAVLVVDRASGLIRERNARAEALFGEDGDERELAELLGRPEDGSPGDGAAEALDRRAGDDGALDGRTAAAVELVAPSDRSRAGEVRPTHGVAQVNGAPPVLERRLPGPGGRPFWAEIASADGAVDGREHRLVIVRDVTPRKIAESDREEQRERVHQARRMEAVGTLAGGIAHDLNGILTVILGNLSLARLEEDPDERDARLEDAEDGCLRAASLATRLLTFAQGGQPLRRRVKVEPVLRDAVALTFAGSSVRCDLISAPDIGAADLDPGQMVQALQNVLLNARQATEAAVRHGGVVRVTAQRAADGPADHVPPLGDGPFVRIEILDHGMGIASDALPRIFDPYFTTRPGGTGLGLASTYSIVRNHGGGVHVESVVGSGTSFTMWLPASAVDVEEVVPQQPWARPRGWRVLVLEDDASVGQLAARFLAQLGHEVRVEPEGERLIAAYDRAVAEGRPYDLLVLDLTIPGGMGGLATLEALRARHPAVRAVVSSGYSTDPVMSRFADHGFVGALPKPYTLEDLERLLGQIAAAVGDGSDRSTAS